MNKPIKVLMNATKIILHTFVNYRNENELTRRPKFSACQKGTKKGWKEYTEIEKKNEITIFRKKPDEKNENRV